MGFGRKKGQQQTGGGERRQFVWKEALMMFFVPFADEAEATMLKQAELEAAIETGGRKDIERPTDDAAFRNRLTQLRTRIGNGLRKASENGPDWFGPFDGWLKSYANEAYGPDSEFAQQHGADGDWAGKMIYVVLPGQVSKHNTLAKWAESVTMPLVETKTGFKPIYEAVLAKLAEDAPKRSDYESTGEHLKALAKREKLVSYFRRTRRDVEDWLSGKKPDHEGSQTPVKDEKDQLCDGIADDRQRLTELRKQLANQASAGKVEVLAGTMASIKEVEASLKDAEAKLAEIDGKKKDGATERLDRAAKIVVDEPTTGGELTSKPTVSGDAEAAKKAAGDTAAKIEAMKAEIELFKNEVTNQRRAAEEHRQKAAEVYAEADELRKIGDRKGSRNKEMEAEREENAAVTAEQMTTKAETKITELNAELERLMKSTEQKPLAEKKKAKAKAKVKPTEEPTEATSAKVEAGEVKTDDDAPPKPTGNLKHDLAAQILYWGGKGNIAMVEALTPALKALGG